eukprot:7533857-Prorocentrum_lima.AAC.1
MLDIGATNTRCTAQGGRSFGGLAEHSGVHWSAVRHGISLGTGASQTGTSTEDVWQLEASNGSKVDPIAMEAQSAQQNGLDQCHLGCTSLDLEQTVAEEGGLMGGKIHQQS